METCLKMLVPALFVWFTLFVTDVHGQCSSIECLNGGVCNDTFSAVPSCLCTGAFAGTLCGEQPFFRLCDLVTDDGDTINHVYDYVTTVRMDTIPHRQQCYSLMRFPGATTVNFTFTRHNIEAQKDELYLFPGGEPVSPGTSGYTSYDDTNLIDNPQITFTNAGPNYVLMVNTDKNMFSNFTLEIDADRDDCFSAPCLNGATCQDRLRSYRCECPIDFEGENCENGIVVVESTTPNVISINVREGFTTQTLGFDLTLSPADGNTFSITGGSGLWMVSGFFSPASDGVTAVGGGTIDLTAPQQAENWEPPSNTIIAAIQANSVPVPANILCSDMQYFCARIDRGLSPSPDFRIIGDPDETALRGCTSVTCRGVEIIGSSLTITSGDLREGITQTVTANFNLQSNAAGGAVSGTALWRLGFFSSDTPTSTAGNGALGSAFPQPYNVGVTPGQDAEFNDLSFEVDLSGQYTCDDIPYICIIAAKNVGASPDFTLTTIPNDDVLSACTSITCRGVEISETNLDVIENAIQEGTSQELSIEVSFSSVPEAGSVGGSDLIDVVFFLTNSDVGTGNRFDLTNAVPLSVTEINAGEVVTELNIAANFDLTDGPICSGFSHICVEMERGASSSVDYQLSGNLIGCQQIACRGVEISDTSVTVSGAILEGRSEILTLNIILQSISEAGSVSGSGLIEVISFLSNDANGLGTRYDTSSSTASPGDHGFQGVTAGTPAQISNFDVNFDLTDGPTCSAFNYVCVEIQRGTSPSVEYQFSGNPSDAVLTGCTLIPCRGVEVSGTSVGISGGEIIEGITSLLNFDVALQTSADGGSVSGTGLWQALAFGSSFPDGSGIRYLETPVNFPATAANAGVVAGQVTSLSGLDASFTLSSSVTCAEFQYLCVQIQRGGSPIPDFSLSAVPDQDSLIGCAQTRCGGIEITETVLQIQSGYLREGFSPNTIAFDISLISNPDGGSVSGSGLWDVTSWISTDPTGVAPRFLEQSINLSPEQSGTPIVSGEDTALMENVMVTWDLSGGPLCTQATYMCVRVEKGASANPDFQVSGQPNNDVFTDCALITCRDVAITSTELNLQSASILEGASQTLVFDYTINSDPLAGGVSGANLWELFFFLSDDQFGSNPINEQQILLNQGQANSAIFPGTPTELTSVDTVANLQNGPTCSQFSHACVRLMKSSGANPDFGLTESSDPSAFIACQAVTCTGVRITSTRFNLLSGDIREGTPEEVRFDFILESDAAGGSVSGSQLWNVTFFGSQDGTGLGPRVQPQVIDLTTAQGETAITAGTSAVISGLALSWDLTDGPLCSEFDFICARVEKHDSSSLDFALSGIPGDTVLTDCVSAICRGVEITQTTVSTISPEVLEGTDQGLDLSITLESNSLAGSVNGDDLWRVNAFLSADPNGNGVRLNENNIPLTAAQSGLDINAGSAAQLASLVYQLDLVGGTTCSEFQYVCVEVLQGLLPNPAFRLENTPGDIRDCIPITCRGVEITDSAVTFISGGVREGVTGQNLILNFALQSNQLAGSVSGTNLWNFEVFGSSTADGSGDRVTQVVLPTSSHYNTPIVAGVDAVFDDIAIRWDMDAGSTCADVQYVCFEVSKNDASTPDFTLVSSGSVLRDCIALDCRGVEVTGTSLEAVSGDELVEGDAAHEVVFNIVVDSDPAGGSVSGENLWQVRAYASDSSTPGGSVISPIDVTLTPSQSREGIVAGTTTTIEGMSAILDLSGALCSEGVEGFCVVFQQNPFSPTSFTFDPQPNDNILTSCIPATCTGVQITDINFNINSGATLIAGSSRHDIDFDINIITDADGAGVSGSNLWEAELFLNSQIDGQGTTTVSAPTVIPLNGETLTAGVSYTLEGVNSFLDLSGLACNLPFLCVRLNKNPNSNPDFTLSASADSLVSCQSLPCMDTDECNPNPCRNGGICTDLINAYSCNCPAGYSGTNCEEDIDECNSFPCQNGGICMQGVNTFTCNCAAGYTGTFCTDDIDECASAPCQNGGICNNFIASYTCTCQAGYTGTNCQININECNSFPCQNGGTCTDLINRYRCDCAPGYGGDNCQTNIDECASFPCRNGGNCIDLIDAYTCMCQPGWTGFTCDMDVDECLSNPCVNGQCNGRGTNFYICTCDPGYTGTNCDMNIDDCSPNPCLNGGQCIDEINGYRCICEPGWTDTNCQIDINECEETTNPCNGNGVCRNLQNRFECVCSPGWTGPRCSIDIDECESSPCENGGTCDDGINFYTCMCPDGYTGVTCNIEINECTREPCENGGTCEDGTNTFVCRCQDGWEGPTCATDINECASSPCLNGGTCTHGVNFYVCQCTPAWFGDNCEREREECSSNPCQNGGTCNELTNGNGYECTCAPGYTGTHCETNINECKSGPCMNGGMCIDGINGFTCDCVDGYTGTICNIEINECSSSPCVNGGTCDDRIAFYVCTCAPGWTGANCDIDILECDSFPCQNAGVCTDSINAYSCNCQAGYTGINCQTDINECSSSPCLNGGTCGDFVNFYSCTCIAGFTGQNCEMDVDECVSGPCLNDGTCVDNINSFTCECASGFGGTFCQIDIDECASSPCRSGAVCNDLIDGYECICQPGTEGPRCFIDINECASFPCLNGGVCTDLPNAYTCTCLPGYTGTDCQIDVDECSSGPCMNGGICTEEIDFFSCQCISGFEGLRCQTNINECASNPCQNGGVCTDGVNSFSCTCANGWTGTKCEIELDECESNPCVNGECEDGVYAFTCYCDPGWTGQRCDIPIDECTSGPCENGGSCTDGINSYSCQCLPGWTGFNCEIDINECGSNPCLNGARCQDGLNQYTCICAAGWTGTRCEIDIDECASFPCLNSGSCINSQNGYMCTCTPAYTGTNCQIEVDECQSNPCLNGGFCNDRINFYTCTCASGYTGVHCETPIRYCSSNPCVRGICVDEVNAFSCVCDAGWTDVLCSTNIDDCAVNLCLNGGTCIDGVNSFRCSCAPGWTGDLCGQDVDECASNPCRNGGICNNLQNMFTCTCPTGYTGVICETEIDECESQPCRNGGLCFVNPNGISFRCACRAGYVGDLCQIDFDECSSNPCINGGTCTDEVNGFRCTCLPGFGGTTCSININDCTENTCLNGGICLDLISGYMCACPQGYSGNNCEINEDECASNPCMNGGECINRAQVHGYDCTCAPGFTGTHCEININECSSSPCMNNGICNDGINSYTCTCSQGWTGVHCEISIGCRVNYTLGVGGKVIINSPNYPSNYGNGENCLWFITGINGRDVNIDFKDFITENRYDNFIVGVGPDPNIGSQRMGFSGPVKPGENSLQGVNTIWIRFQTDSEKTDRGFSVEFRDSAYQVITPCDARPCINGGVCSNVGKINFRCDCNNLWTGQNCELPSVINKCGLNPCTNGAECMNAGEDYTCLCPAGFTGKNCTDDIDECAQNPCQNGGECFNLINAYACACLSCYSGRNCELAPPSAACSVNLCENGGDCSYNRGTYDCSCAEGYDGEYCQNDTDRCRFNPCNFGSCSTLNDNYQCTCQEGYMGTQCDIQDTTDCVNANPCQNGAACMVENGTYSCDCPVGFQGEYCSENINDCLDETCSGKGVCVDGINGFTCVCRSGYLGTRCQIDVDECASNPCLNGGVCLNQANGFTCICTGSFVLPLCTQEQIISSGGSQQSTFRGTRITLDPYFILLIVALALFAIFFLLLFLIANCCRARTDQYDTEKARLGEYPSQTRAEMSILANAEPPGTRENDYAIHGPIPPSGGGNVSTMNSFENPWPQSEDELRKTAL
ncbi:uncharacterized protein LOC121423126 [Lytechinus variegatus]|uniref:uncharacterized protein LOC121423126 n=1 Tax=Lytechinus variegatus TaxID=7654 RepID=UPI001BB15377|nr:uncharacterized protein LOC121423126 [Lytechinus variegatus]